MDLLNMNENKTKKVYCNQAQSAVYVRNPEICKGCPTPKTATTYNELVEKQVGNATIYTLVEREYPITADSVKSYAAAANYKNDVAAAMSMPARGKNLGNMTDLQNLLSSDVERARSIYAELSNKIKEAENLSKQAQQAQQNQANNKVGVNNAE